MRVASWSVHPCVALRRGSSHLPIHTCLITAASSHLPNHTCLITAAYAHLPNRTCLSTAAYSPLPSHSCPLTQAWLEARRLEMDEVKRKEAEAWAEVGATRAKMGEMRGAYEAALEQEAGKLEAMQAAMEAASSHTTSWYAPAAVSASLPSTSKSAS